MSAPLNILIIGSSVAGPALASFLLLSPLPASKKPHITILERAPCLRTEGQNIDIRGTGISIIRKLGIEAEIRASLTGEAGVQHVDANNRVKMHIDASEGGPTAELEILRGDLANILVKRTREISVSVEKAGGKGVEWVFGDYAQDIEQFGDKAEVTFAKSKQKRSFDLVVGADGLHSRTRRTIWGTEGEQERLHNFNVYVAFFSMPPGKTDTAYRRWYRAPGRCGFMVRPDKLHDRTTCAAYVMNDTDKRFADLALQGASVDQQKELMAEYLNGIGWESKRCMKQMWASEDFYYSMIAQVKMEKWSKGRVVLLGDAAYCASPLSGMGTTLALNGAYNLAGLLLHHNLTGPQSSQSFERAFDAYEAKMRPLVTRAQKLSPGVPSLLFGCETEWGIWWLLTIGGWLAASAPLFKLIFHYLGPPAESISVDDFGFEDSRTS